MPGYGKYRSPEEKEEFVKQLGADAKQRVIDLAENWEADAKDVAEFLIFSSRFPDYSVRNQMLIYKQNPYPQPLRYQLGFVSGRQTLMEREKLLANENGFGCTLQRVWFITYQAGAPRYAVCSLAGRKRRKAEPA